MNNKIILICCVALTIASAQDCSNVPNKTFLPDGTGCNLYIACVDRTTTSLVCPSGFHFNYERQLCDYPSKAGCIKCPATGFANLPVDGNCKKFVQCFLGFATDRECPPGLLFDPTYGQCNVQSSVQCQ